MNCKRPHKTVLMTDKKSKKYYESRTSSQLETNEIDFSQFATFNVDFDDFMRPPVVNNKKDSEKKQTKLFRQVFQSVHKLLKLLLALCCAVCKQKQSTNLYLQMKLLQGKD